MDVTTKASPARILAKEFFRLEIIDRRSKLQAAAGTVSELYLLDLLAEVDAALERLDNGNFGLCETCHDAIEEDRLAQNPLVRFCLDHLSASEMKAHQQDIDLATRIQSGLLPRRDLALDSWEMHYCYHPAGPVGGDYCELIPQDHGSSLFFAVGDVSGKGVAASLLMTHLSAIFRSLLSLDLCVDDVMLRANRLFCDRTASGHYATVVCGMVSGESIQIANAGHCKPILLRKDGWERLECAGLPLGLFCGVKYELCGVQASAGDCLLLYSDGISETQNAHGEEFGEDRLVASAQSSYGQGARVMAEGIRNDVLRYRTPLPPVDDETILVLRKR